MKILVINSGSSSLKYKLFSIDDSKEEVLCSGLAENIGSSGSRIKYSTDNGNEVYDINLSHHQDAIDCILNELLVSSDRQGVIKDMSELDAIGHRIVHGGEKFKKSVVIDDEVINAIEDYVKFAPLHNPANLNGIYSCKSTLPDMKQVAVFDTAFHQSMPDHAYMYALPYELYKEKGFRRYGFHGTSHLYVSQQASEILGKKEYKIVTCHLGNGGSIAAVKDGKSMDTSMGFTPLEGLMMGTRSGDVDPAVVLSLSEELSIKDADKILNKESGLLGITGLSNDFRDILGEIENNGEKKALCELALEMYVYKIKKYIGSYIAALGGCDAIIFTAGVGENCPEVREKVLENMEYLGVEFSKEKNAAGEEVLSTDDSKVKVLIIPTDEELVIARDTYGLTK